MLRRHAASAQVEAQARAVEYGQLFGYDALRPALLERMPPLDEAAYARALGTAAAIQAAGAPLVRALVLGRVLDVGSSVPAGEAAAAQAAGAPLVRALPRAPRCGAGHRV